MKGGEKDREQEQRLLRPLEQEQPQEEQEHRRRRHRTHAGERSSAELFGERGELHVEIVGGRHRGEDVLRGGLAGEEGPHGHVRRLELGKLP